MAVGTGEDTSSEDVGSGQARSGRRQFIKQAGAAAVSVVFAGIGLAAVAKGAATPAMAESGGVIMPDPSLCIGCLTCEVACSDVHREAGLSDVPRIRIYYQPEVQVEPQIVQTFGDRGHFFQQVCLQCPDAPCVPVCPVNALHVDPKTGARVIDAKTCIACGKCNQACLFPSLDESLAVNTIRFGQASRITYDSHMNVFGKCDLCNFRAEGPACVERCPVNIRIQQGIIKSDVPCLALAKPENQANFDKMRKQQTVSASRQEIQQ
jgi:Fe-S-cluster-containing hydrogenase component 2